LGNACYHSVQSLLSSHLLSRNVKVKIYKTIILPVVLYGCGTWSLTLREEHRLRAFENRVLRRIFGSMRDEVMGEQRELHSGELHNFYSSPGIVKQIKLRRKRWVGHVVHMGGGETSTGFCWESLKEKDYLKGHGIDGRMRSKWTLGRLVGWGCVESIHLARYGDCWWAVVNALMNLLFLVSQH
jgi:hypothetical protein